MRWFSSWLRISRLFVHSRYIDYGKRLQRSEVAQIIALRDLLGNVLWSCREILHSLLFICKLHWGQFDSKGKYHSISMKGEISQHFKQRGNITAFQSKESSCCQDHSRGEPIVLWHYFDVCFILQPRGPFHSWKISLVSSADSSVPINPNIVDNKA